MGLIFRILRWVWNRIGDAFTVSDLLDFFDLKTAAIAVLGFIGMLFFGAMNYDWSSQAIVFVSLIAGACVSLIFIALRILWSMFKKRDIAHNRAQDIALIAAQAELERQHRLREKQNDHSRQADTGQRELAGLVNAMMDRAGQWDFRLPLQPGNRFIDQYERLRDSEHPIWTDKAANQLRRDFLNLCGRTGQEYDDVSEARQTRTELREIGDKLVARLMSQVAPTTLEQAREEVRISLLDLIETAKNEYGWDFDDPSLHLLDLLYGLRQAGSDSTIYFYGKINRNQSESINRNELVVPIDPVHWRDYEFEIWGALRNKDNYYVWTLNKRANQPSRGGYTDIHALRLTAINWLKGEADKFKGHYR